MKIAPLRKRVAGRHPLRSFAGSLPRHRSGPHTGASVACRTLSCWLSPLGRV